MAEPLIIQTVQFRDGALGKYEGPGDEPETVKVRRWIPDGKTVQLSEAIEQVNEHDLIPVQRSAARPPQPSAR